MYQLGNSPLKREAFLIASILTAIFFLTATTVFAQDSAYESLPADKSLQTSPQFLVVDDFNTGKFVIRQGAGWRVKAPAVGALDLSIDKIDARNPVRGYSLKAHFNLQPDEKASLETFLDRMDVSKAAQLVFRLRAELKDQTPFTGKVYLTLSDWQHKKSIQEITTYLPDKMEQWSDVILPADLFNDLDKDQLVSFALTLASQDVPLVGNLWLDEIAFSGPGDLMFACQRDNIVSFPEEQLVKKRTEELKRQKNDKKLLLSIAQDTWKYFVNARDKNTNLVVDHLRLGEAPLIADYTSPTNIAMDLMGTLAAMDLQIINEKEARTHVGTVLSALKRMTKYRGFFYNFYDTKKLSVERSYISSVDSGWLAIALVVIRQAFHDAFYEEATQLLDGFDFGDFLDPENNQMVVGFDVPARNFGQYHYGLLVTEARATSLYAIGKGDVPKEHWWFLYRTLPEVWAWQKQKPVGRYVSHDGVEYFQGYYEKNGKKFVPSWGGSLFEYLMPTLVLKERELAPKGLGLNDRIATELHRDYALKEKGYPVWGLSPCAVSNGRKWTYREFGVPGLGSKGYPDGEVATPHVSFLALDSLPKEAIQNIRRFLDFEMYGEYGFYDALELKTGKANPQYLALDQGMTLVAIANYLGKGAIQNRFHADPIGKKTEDFLRKESFFNA